MRLKSIFSTHITFTSVLVGDTSTYYVEYYFTHLLNLFPYSSEHRYLYHSCYFLRDKHSYQFRNYYPDLHEYFLRLFNS